MQAPTRNSLPLTFPSRSTLHSTVLAPRHPSIGFFNSSDWFGAQWIGGGGQLRREFSIPQNKMSASSLFFFLLQLTMQLVQDSC